MNEENQEYTIIRPGEPGYDELAPDVDTLGGKPLPLTAGLRFVESELYKLKKMKKQGYKTTIPELADGSGNELEARPIDERIAELEKMKIEYDEAVAFLENIEPGLSRKPGSGRLYDKLMREKTEKEK